MARANDVLPHPVGSAVHIGTSHSLGRASAGRPARFQRNRGGESGRASFAAKSVRSNPPLLANGAQHRLLAGRPSAS